MDPELDRHKNGNLNPDRYQHDADPQHQILVMSVG
jgi:hypothetical protein